MLVADETPPIEMPSRILTTHQLRQAQQALARSGGPPHTHQELPLASLGGRILARDLALRPAFDTSHHGPVLRAGTLLDWYLLPLLAASGHASAPVHAPVRCGIVAMPVPGGKVAAVTLQAALERMGVKTFIASAIGLASHEEPAVRTFSRCCDLVLVMGADERGDKGGDAGGEGRDGGGLQAPRVISVQNRPCVILPACPLAALGRFVTFVVPLIRRLQGRLPELPLIRSAFDSGAPGQPVRDSEPSCVSVGACGKGEAPRVRACAPAPGLAVLSLAEVSGIAWRAEDLRQTHDSAVAYLPLAEWLH